MKIFCVTLEKKFVKDILKERTLIGPTVDYRRKIQRSFKDVYYQ
jgi:hypothetical protein